MISTKTNSLSTKEEELSSSQVSHLENLFIDKQETYSCTECSSNIEVISIDNNEANITFRCLNKDKNNNHQIQKMPISTYLKKMEKNTFLFDKCSICSRDQSSINNFSYLKYCVKCKTTFCNECKEKHINSGDNNHFFINNNEKGIKCLLHPNNKNTEYCINCKTHLCEECIKTGKHLSHETKSLMHFSNLKEKKEIIEKNIDYLKKTKKQMLENKNSKLNELNDLLKNKKAEIETDLKNKIQLEEIKEKEEIVINESKKKEELEKIKAIYESQIKKIEIEYNSKEEIIKKNYRELIEKYKNSFNEKMNKIRNEIKIFFDEKIDTKIIKINDLISIYEIIKKTQEKYQDNYYNNINIFNAISSFGKSDNKNELFNLKNEEINFNQSNIFDMNNNNNNNLFKLNPKSDNIDSKTFLNKKVKKENTTLSNIKRMKIETDNYKDKDKDNKIIERSRSVIKKSKRNNINEIKEKKVILNNNNKNIKKEIDNSFNFKKQKTDNSHKSNCDLLNDSNINNIIFDSYCPTDIDYSFAVFISFKNNNAYIVYADMHKYIYCHNLMKNQKEKAIKNAHVEPISSIRYYCNNKKEYIMSISYKNRQIKIWNFNNWQEIVNIKEIYPEGFLYSACFIKDNHKIYFLTSNWVDTNSADLIRIYDLQGKRVNVINESNENVLLMDIYFDKEKNTNYIIISNRGYIKSYNYNKNKLYSKYQDIGNNSKINSFIIYKENNILKIIESSDNGTIRLWDFHSGILNYKFSLENIWFGGICLYNNDHILVGCGDKTIKLISLKIGAVVKTLTGHEGKVCCIKKLNIDKLGKCFFSLGKDNKIRTWKNIKCSE